MIKFLTLKLRRILNLIVRFHSIAKKCELRIGNVSFQTKRFITSIVFENTCSIKLMLNKNLKTDIGIDISLISFTSQIALLYFYLFHFRI